MNRRIFFTVSAAVATLAAGYALLRYLQAEATAFVDALANGGALL